MPPTVDAQLDLLMDLQHDLGKYIRMPLGFLPANASDEEVHRALDKALLRTRQTPLGNRSARDLWTAFCAEAPAALKSQALFADLERAVDRALAWEKHALAQPGPLPRPALEADLNAVGPAIRALINHLQS
jgi:hypothetical protein